MVQVDGPQGGPHQADGAQGGQTVELGLPGVRRSGRQRSQLSLYQVGSGGMEGQSSSSVRRTSCSGFHLKVKSQFKR